MPLTKPWVCWQQCDHTPRAHPAILLKAAMTILSSLLNQAQPKIPPSMQQSMKSFTKVPAHTGSPKNTAKAMPEPPVLSKKVAVFQHPRWPWQHVQKATNRPNAGGSERKHCRQTADGAPQTASKHIPNLWQGHEQQIPCNDQAKGTCGPTKGLLLKFLSLRWRHGTDAHSNKDAQHWCHMDYKPVIPRLCMACAACRRCCDV